MEAVLGGWSLPFLVIAFSLEILDSGGEWNDIIFSASRMIEASAVHSFVAMN